MIIQINTDKNISGNQKLLTYINTKIAGEFSRFSDHISRIEVHLSDENGSKGGQDDKRCMLEARLKNRQPIVATSEGGTLEQAVNDTIDKVKTLIDTISSQKKSH